MWGIGGGGAELEGKSKAKTKSGGTPESLLNRESESFWCKPWLCCRDQRLPSGELSQQQLPPWLGLACRFEQACGEGKTGVFS